MDPVVSVYCLSYNHEKYIRSALDGFVSQKTTFPFEVIVHDDASTDKSADIIKAYAEKYPEIIKPIIQKENQYSKGINISNTIISPLLRGKYIAICEGDDYWCDSYKLQRQVEWLDNHPEYSFCVHNTKVMNCSDGREYLLNTNSIDKDLSTEEIIEWKPGLIQTSSYMYRSEYAIVPSAFSIKGAGDYSRAVYLATCGKVRFLSNVMSVYRYLTPESWSMKISQSADAVDRQIQHWQNRIAMLRSVNEYTLGKYADCISEVIRRYEFNIHCKKMSFRLFEKSLRIFTKSLD